MKKSTSGFTIVELLIVIVVIAILATISIVAYNGIQQRSNNAKTVSAVTAYVKVLNLYKIDNGQFPAVAGVCLGSGYDSGCDSNGSYLVNRSNFNTSYLEPYFKSSIPMPAKNLGELVSGRQLGGAFYVWNDVNYGGTNNGGIGTYNQGNGDCPPIGGLTFVSTMSYFDGSGRLCRYSMN